MKRKIFAWIIGLSLLFGGVAYASWPSTGARTKDWGNETLTDTDLEGQFDLIWTYINDMMNSSTGHTHTGATGEGPKIPINSSLTIASQAQGDIIYATSSSAWARLGAGTNGQFLKTQGAGANPVWATANTPPQYRNNLYCSQASSTTITVSPGDIEINGSIVSVTSATTLTLTTSTDWATTQKQQASTYSFIGVDSSGHVEMGSTAPTNDNYALSTTAGVKRYVSWTGGTNAGTYRVIGWFYMNSTGSGQLNSYEVGNIKDPGVINKLILISTGSVNGTTLGSDTNALIHYYSVGFPVKIIYDCQTGESSSAVIQTIDINVDSSSISSTSRSAYTGRSTTSDTIGLSTHYQYTPSQGTRTFQGEFSNGGSGTAYINARTVNIEEG